MCEQTLRSGGSAGPAKRWSLAARMVLLTVVPTLLITLLGGWWLRYEVHASLYASFSRTLEEKSQRIAARLHVSPEGLMQESVAGGDEFSAIFSGWYWQAQMGSEPGARAARSRSLWDQSELVVQPQSPLGTKVLRRAVGPQGEPLLAQAFTLTLAGASQAVALQVFGPAESLWSSMQRLDRILLTTGGVLLLLLCVLVWLQLRIGLAPLRRLVAVIAGLRRPGHDAQPATQQIAQLALGPDLAPLQHELAELMAQNAQVVARARSHAADLNHALKKPLSLLTAQAGTQPMVDSAFVLAQAKSMARLIDRYQARTHSDAVQSSWAGAGPQVDVRSCAQQMLAMMRQLHQAQELDWQLHAQAPALLWRGERADLEELLGNLLDNAGKWAASAVQLRLGAGNGGLLEIAIDDDGPGMTPAQLQAAGVRGQRFDETVDGTGLGLAIAQQIARSYGGSMSLHKSLLLKGLGARVVMAGLVE